MVLLFYGSRTTYEPKFCFKVWNWLLRCSITFVFNIPSIHISHHLQSLLPLPHSSSSHPLFYLCLTIYPRSNEIPAKTDISPLTIKPTAQRQSTHCSYTAVKDWLLTKTSFVSCDALPVWMGQIQLSGIGIRRVSIIWSGLRVLHGSTSTWRYGIVIHLIEGLPERQTIQHIQCNHGNLLSHLSDWLCSGGKNCKVLI